MGFPSQDTSGYPSEGLGNCDVPNLHACRGRRPLSLPLTWEVGSQTVDPAFGSNKGSSSNLLKVDEENSL